MRSKDTLAVGVAAAALMFELGGPVRTQGSQFLFDSDGNLEAWTPENLTLPQILAQPHQQVVVPGQLASAPPGPGKGGRD